MNKKGFEIQFNWIFILIAGAMILMFFAVAVLKQKSASETSIKATALKSIEAIITGAGVSTDTITTTKIPNINIEIGCNKVALGGVSKQYQNLILFSPEIIKGDKLVTHALASSTPYRATNLLYMTSPKIRYILIGNNNLAWEINKSLPSELNKEFYDKTAPSIVNNQNNYKVRFIIFDSNLNPNYLKNLQKMQDSDVTAIKINGDLQTGQVEFFQKDKSSWKSKGASKYLTKSSLLGAVYSDTLENYECNMENTFSRLKLVTKIYIDRTNDLRDTASAENQIECVSIYDNSLVHLGTISGNSGEFKQGNKVNEIAGAADLLSEQNKEAQKFSCALIY